MTQAEKIIARLEQGPANSAELNAICFRYAARIHELRKDGYDIRSDRLKQGLFLFTLIKDKETTSWEQPRQAQPKPLQPTKPSTDQISMLELEPRAAKPGYSKGLH